ncbi:MAG: Fur family transcriptional regulator [Sulfuricurvum sp. PC08-66]|nr:MAG: Fur family transcriptional regulator [Sulfuricurvum sp. PC08-66]
MLTNATLDYAKLLEEFKELLRHNGLKYTTQREIILKTLYDNSEHVTPEFLNKLIQEAYPDIKVGIATVYRTLSLLEDAQIVTSLSFGAQGKKYELDRQHHHDHMICTMCSKIIEFFDPEIERLQEEIAQKNRFRISDHSMQIYGICESCQTNPPKRGNH